MWSPIQFKGDPSSDIQENMFDNIINTEPLNLLYRIREYLRVAQAGTSWFSETFSDVLEFDKTVRLNGQPPLSDPLLLLDKKAAADHMNMKL
jgi:hypothetical protein